MAAINVVLNGTFTTDTGATNGTFVGQMAYSDRGVGGGPILPSGDHIWGGGNVPMPSPPIANVPGAPGYQPPSDAHPEHPIVLPPDEPPPTNPPDSDGFLKPPPEGGWGYHQVYGWLYNPKEDVATPKR